MYAIVAESGSQLFLEENTKIQIDLRDGIHAGDEIEFDRVLAIGGAGGDVTIGKPLVAGAKVVGQVIRHLRLKKIHVGFYRKRKNSRLHKGHRQSMTEVQITKIIPA